MNGKVVGLLAMFVCIALVAWMVTRYLTAKKAAEAAAIGDRDYRRLADEYRRLAEMAITTQEHADLKLGDLSVRLDLLRDQMDSVHRVLKEVE